ncbi:MAG TPA: nitrilase-related carbon-nitrogen hydrolase, partial [Bryobacteraceae bacterium]|nr:nitrilase-related carbon-nitrogen hydrolase [Bryobacteraceae bacterium]
MQELRIATAQFESRDGDKQYNLGRIEALARQAAAQGAKLVLFHELCITGYTWLERLSRDQIVQLAEPWPDGESIQRLAAIARDTECWISAGFVEILDGRLHNAQAVVSPEGPVVRHHKLHEFVSEHLDCGDHYTLFDALGWRFGVLTCYDNNLPENARMTAMLGADVILMPHVTGCLPSPAPGRGTVDRSVWENRRHDPVRCRMEFDGPKARGWIMKWLPARAWENGVYAVYSNVLGDDGGTIKPGGSMIVDPYGEVVAECRTMEDEVVVAPMLKVARELASGA